MKKVLAAVVKIWHLPFVKYSLIAIIGIVLVGFVGKNSVLAHFRNELYISELASEIEKYEQHEPPRRQHCRQLHQA